MTGQVHFADADHANNLYYVALPVETLRYLGFFLNHKLDWEPHVKTMCNRVQASIRALLVLGNSVQGLSMANWCLAFNAVCLPVLTYGCQLWYTMGGRPKGLINMLQKVQNEGVKVITGAFCMAPRKALLHITHMLPMQHHLEKLTYTSALHLYRVPMASQLLRRLVPEWYAPRLGDLLLPTPTNRPGPRHRLTVLEALAARIPSNGPCVDTTAVAPWEVPAWVLRHSRDDAPDLGKVTSHMTKQVKLQSHVVSEY